MRALLDTPGNLSYDTDGTSDKCSGQSKISRRIHHRVGLSTCVLIKWRAMLGIGINAGFAGIGAGASSKLNGASSDAAIRPMRNAALASLLCPTSGKFGGNGSLADDAVFDIIGKTGIGVATNVCEQ